MSTPISDTFAAQLQEMRTDLLAQLRARYPGITVNLRLGNAQETLAALLSEHADVAVLTEVDPRKGLHLQALTESRMCALVPQGHPWAQAEGVALKQLDQVIMVLREPSSITRRTFDEASDQARIRPLEMMEQDSREAVTEAVSSSEAERIAGFKKADMAEAAERLMRWR